MAKAKTKKPLVDLSKGPKKGERGYTASKLSTHLAGAVAAAGLPDLSKKQAAAVVESLVGVLFAYAPVGAKIPGLGKVVLREIPAKPARTIVSFGKEIQVKAKPKSAKLVFRFAKEAKEKFKK